MAELASTGKIRRNTTGTDPSSTGGSRFRQGKVIPATPIPVVRPQPHGDLDTAPAEVIAKLAGRVWQQDVRASSERRRQARAMLGFLEGFDGGTWQQRWDACPYAGGGLPRFGLPNDPNADAGLAFKALLCLRVVQPTLAGMSSLAPDRYAEWFRAAQHDPALDGYFEAVQQHAASRQAKQTALYDVARALTVFGIRFAELTPEALLQHSWDCCHDGVMVYERGAKASFAAKLAWAVLVDMGHFPAGTPPTIRAAGQRGQLSVTELVDQSPIANAEVRQLLIDYLTRRALTLDYSTLRNLARQISGLFWYKIEQLAPGIADLHIPSRVYDQWRAGIGLRHDGKERLSIDPILLAVRSMYLDLHTWSVSEPQRWGPWVAPCPIRPGEFAESGKRERRRLERSHQRTRARQPLLPILVSHVTSRLAHLRQLLAAATPAQPGQRITVDGRRYVRVWTDYDQQHRADHPVRVTDVTAGLTLNVRVDEDAAFWEWALIEVLRLSGCRIEEALELTQLSIRKYVRPNGEAIGLLVIAPSKTERERVIPMSAELFAVIAAIIRRHHETLGKIPILPRYDSNEKVHTEPMPFLFQRKHGPARLVIGAHHAADMLRRRCQDLAATHPEFGQARFTPHDFRRLFATDVVNNGLPIHIGAALLGHMDLGTTRGYVAVFEEDLIRHYQTFLERRRQLRPTEEYRPATEHEWTEFEEHFDKRKVELGNCGRPYGTGCQHEHSCIRCPMLHVAADALPRLDIIELDLQDRRKRAEAENWLGEIEGIDLTLAHLQRKRAQVTRLTTSPNIPIGPPLG